MLGPTKKKIYILQPFAINLPILHGGMCLTRERVTEIEICVPSLLHFWIFLNHSLAFAKTPGLVHRILIFSLNEVGLVPLFLTSRSQLEKDLSSCLLGCLPC